MDKRKMKTYRDRLLGRREGLFRQVTEAEVEYVLENPAIDWPSKEHPETRRVYTARPGGRKVSVVTVNGSEPPLVVTVWAD